jgi:hypothetical protein
MVVCIVTTRLSNVSTGILCVNGFRKVVKASNGDFKPQHRDRAKYTVETNGTLDIGEVMCGDES